MARQGARKCSICKNFGHTKKGCVLNSMNTQEQGDKINLSKSEKPNTKPPVVVRVSDKSKSSPYVINLRHEDEDRNILAEVPVYTEPTVNPEIVTKTVDLASEVKEANKILAFRRDVENINLLLKDSNRFKNLRKARAEFKEINTALKAERKREKVRKQVFEFTLFKSLSESMAGFKFKRFALQSIVLLLIVTTAFPAFGYYTKLKAAGEVVVDEGTDAFLALQASTIAAFQSDLGLAQQELMHALQSFSVANSVVEKDFQLLLNIGRFIPIVGTQVSSRQNLLAAGSHLALGNTYLLKGIDESQKNGDLVLTERLQIFQHHMQSALTQYNEAMSYLDEVNISTVPVKYQQTFTEFKVLFGTFVDDMKDMVELSSALNTIFGNDSFKRYMVVFQNHHELRPTGGFMGSFAIVDVQKGKILNIDVPKGGTYDIKGQLTEFVKPPLPLQLLNTRWEFQDSNWFPDFAASAKKMSWFYEHGRGATVDGVIAINATVLQRVLKVMGSVEVKQLLLDESNALETLQYKVEVGYDKKTEKPKEIIADILSNLMESLKDLNSVDIMNLLVELHGALEQKEIQVYMNDQNVENKLRSFGWTGEIIPTQSTQDYVSVIHTNIQGQKSDAKIKQTINHEATVNESGEVVDTVVIERAHTGTPGEQFYGGVNISYVRVYVPEGAELIDAQGFSFPPEAAFRVPETWYENDELLGEVEKDEQIHLGTGTRITKEFGKTVFGNWVITEPGATSKIYFKYKLPFRVPLSKLPEHDTGKWQSIFVPAVDKQTSRYSLLVQKQSGIDSDFSSTIIYPQEWLPVWRSNDKIDMALNGARYTTVLKTDEVVGLVLERDVQNNKQ